MFDYSNIHNRIKLAFLHYQDLKPFGKSMPAKPTRTGASIKKASCNEALFLRLMSAFLKTPGNNAVRGIIRRDANLDSISFHHSNASLLHPSTEYSPDNRTIFTFDLHASATHNLSHHAFELDQIVSAHSPPLGIAVFHYRQISAANTITRRSQ